MIEFLILFAVALFSFLMVYTPTKRLWDTPSRPITPTPSWRKGDPIIVRGSEVPKSILGDLIIPKGVAEYKFDQIKKRLIKRYREGKR